MALHRSSAEHDVPDDPVGEAMASSISQILRGATVERRYTPGDLPVPPRLIGATTASETSDGPDGWTLTLTVSLHHQIATLIEGTDSPLLSILRGMPGAGLRAAAQFRMRGSSEGDLTPSLHRALRDTVVAELLGAMGAGRDERRATTQLMAETIEFLIELSGIRVESHDLTHGVIITDAFPEEPRLHLDYPDDLRAVKRAPLLFDGQRSVLVVDRRGWARTELQRHRLDRVSPSDMTREPGAVEFAESGWFVAEATRLYGGIGFFLRADHTIWVFADGRPLLMRRGEHWNSVPLELASAISQAIGGNPTTADVVVQTALIISAQRHGAILAVIGDADSMDGIVSPKDRYDLRDQVDPMAERIETRLHHLIDAEPLDAQTLARLAALDGATILDRAGNLIAYGAVVTSSDSEHEGARTAAARSLSLTAEIVLSVSADGDITVFRSGHAVTTLLS